jgi:hypothetical protein
MEHFRFPNPPVATPIIHSDHRISHRKAHRTSSPPSPIRSPDLLLLNIRADMPSDEFATLATARPSQTQTSPDPDDSDSEDQPPIEFSTLMILLRAASIINAKKTDGEVSIPRAVLGEGQAEEENKGTFTSLEAMAAILVQHGEVIATSYISELGAVVVTDSETAISNAVKESDIPDSVLPAEFLTEKVNHGPGVHSPQYVITTNSTKCIAFQGSNPHNLRVAKGGADLWHNYQNGYQWAYAT